MEEVNNDKLLRKCWGKEAEKSLSKDDKFLRDYIMKETWKKKVDDADEEVDEEDERRDDEIDNYERAYNFRFEEPGGAEIHTFARTIDDTMR
jgi:protein KRI1